MESQKFPSFCFFILLIFQATAQDEIQVNSISPHLGSLSGATRISIFGTGFGVDFSLGVLNTTREVFFVNDLNEYPCEIHLAESDERQIACYTVAMPEDKYHVRIKENGAWLKDSQYCHRRLNSYSCRLYVRWFRTPIVSAVTQNENERFITVRGRLYTNVSSSSVVEATNGLQVAINRVWLTSGQPCQIYNESTQLPYRIILDGNEGQSVWGSMDCLMEGTYVGNENISFIVDGDFGRSYADLSSIKVSRDNRLYMIQPFAVINDVSPKVGSTEGGAELTISGDYFDDTSKVYVGGEPCSVTSWTKTEIKCRTPVDPGSKPVYGGGRGIKVELFPGVTDLVDNLGDYPDFIMYADQSGQERGLFELRRFASRNKGLFIPAVDGNYKFSVIADDRIELRFNPEGSDPAGAVLQAYAERHSVYNYTDVFPLLKDHQYYFEVRHLDYGGSTYFRMGVHVDKSIYTPEQTGWAVSEVQQLQIFSTVIKEKQKITFQNWEIQQPVKPVFELATSCIAVDPSNCYAFGFTLTLFGVKTGLINFGSSASQVKEQLENLNVFDDVTVEEDGSNYVIEFETNQGHPDFSVASVSEGFVTAEITVQTQGRPSLSSFAFKIGDHISAALDRDASISDVADVIMNMFAAKCPDQFFNRLGRSRVYHNDGEEDSNIPSGTRTKLNSFCGSYSLQNPSLIYSGSPFSTSNSKYICFAYNGDISNRLQISYTYTDSDGNSIERNSENFWDVGLENTASEWKHFCYDINSRFIQDHSGGRNFKISEIQLHRGEMDLFVDVIYIGDVTVTNLQIENAIEWIIPSYVPHIRLDSVDVNKADDHYNITFNPLDCGYNFPLLGIAFVDSIENESSNKQRFMFAGGNSEIVVERLSHASPPVGGTFDLEFSESDHGVLRGIPANVSPETLKSELESLPHVGSVQVERSLSCFGYMWTVTFESPGGIYPLMTPTNIDLTSSPDTAHINATRTVTGGLNMEPIPGEFLRITYENPQVEVFVNGIPSKCMGDFDEDNQTSCQFNWSLNHTSTMNSVVNPDNGMRTATAGDTLEISGEGFSETQSENQVLVGGVECGVTSSTSEKITCTLGNSPSGSQELSVNVQPHGLAFINTTEYMIQVSGSIDVFAPASGSVYGCQVITITGRGFSSHSTVTIGNSPCTIIEEITYNQIICETTIANPGPATVEVTTAGTIVTASGSFIYTDSGIGSAISLSETILSVKRGELIIQGTEFGTDVGKVYFGSNMIENITSWSDTEITLNYSPLPPNTYPLKVVVGSGCVDTSLIVTYQFEVTRIQPSRGSLGGGTEVVVTGSGLTSETDIKLGEVPCSVQSVSIDKTSLTCLTEPHSTSYNVTNGGRNPEYGIGYAWYPSSLNLVAGDVVTFFWSVPDQVQNVMIGLFSTASTTSMEYDGEGFQVQASRKGQFSYSFNKPGTFYFGSGCVDTNCDIFMRGTIRVSASTTRREKLEATIGSIEATYNSDKFFTFDVDRTPTITDISPQNGTTNSVITITGTGFTTNNPNVTIGGKSCGLTSRTDTAILCQISSSEELSTGVFHQVSVDVRRVGYARHEIQSYIERSFVLLPLITSISPVEGSILGGTKLTILGSGFMEGNEVYLPNLSPCEIILEESSYTQITCITTPVVSAGTGPVQVYQGAISAVCGNTCEFSYSESATPTVTSWSHDGNWEDLTLTFIGTGFGEVKSDLNVRLNSEDISESCVISSVYDTLINCSVQGFPVGRNTLSVSVTGKGFARFDGISNRINQPGVVTSISPNVGSVLGGTTITIQGHGFVEEDTRVFIGSKQFEVVAVSYTEVICVSQPQSAGLVNVVVVSKGVNFTPMRYEFSLLQTPSVMAISPAEGTLGTVLTLTGSGFCNISADVDVKIGEAPCSVKSAKESEITCELVHPHEGGPVDVEVYVDGKGRANVSVNFFYLLTIESVSSLRGSYGGRQPITVTGQGFSANTIVEICENVCAVLNWTNTEIDCMTPSNDDYSSEVNTECDVVVKNGNTSVAHTAPYIYDKSQTAVIKSVSPARGGTGGGTRITITGTGFTSLSSSSSVEIDGSTCDISSVNDTTIECVTNEHKGSIDTKVQVRTGSYGLAYQESADFYYIDRWSSIFTWGGTTVPQDREFVVIQKGQTVLLDTNTSVLSMLLIDGGELIFDEQDVMLNAENILITNGGLLQIGTEDEPYQSQATITMYGNLRSPELPVYGAKTLAVRNGTLEMHGKHVAQPWTKLAQTATVGSNEILLEKPVEWSVGDYIVIASTGKRHSQMENEKHRIADISSDGLILTLTEPLEYEHLGVTEMFDGFPVEFRAEVGLLTRNIKFQGTNNHVWNDKIPKCKEGFNSGQFATQTCFQGRFGEEVGSDQFGGSIMIHSKNPNIQEAKARVENIEITYAGQAFRLGRYPIHWHLMGDVSGQYVRRCSIHNTFNRAVTIHGTHNLTVEHNVVYDIMGGAIFIEDGIETGNVIQYNLAVFVRQSTSLLNDDITPAAYWVTNPDNIIRHNHAAGGTHFGFWYRMHEHPDGPSFTPDVCQQKVELGEFFNNTVHSQGWFGLWIFESYFPMVGGRCDSTVPSPAKFYSLTTWRCEKGAEWVNCGAIQFIDFVMVDNEVAGMDLKLVIGTSWGEEKGALVKNALIVGHSSVEDEESETGVAMTLPYSPGLYIKGARFFNFNRGGVIFQGTTIQGLCVNFCGGFYYWVEDLHFSSVTKKVNWRWLHEGVIVDRDGSLTGSEPFTKVVPYSGVMDTSVCPISTDDAFSSPQFPSAICQPHVRFHRIALNNPIPSSLEGNDLIFKNVFGNTSSIYANKRLTHKPGYMLLLQGKIDYNMYFKDGDQFTNLTYNSKFYDFMESDYLFVSHEFKQTPDRIEISGEKLFDIGATTTLSAQSNNLDWNYEPVTKRFSYAVSGKTVNRKKREIEVVDEDYSHISVQPSVYRCFFEDCIAPLDPDEIPPSREKPDDAFYWSDVALSHPCIEWIENHTVVIKRSTDDIDLCWVVVGISSLYVNNITVQGVLHFESVSSHISSIYIAVLGGRIIAGLTTNDYFDGDLTIELRGDHNTPAWSLPGIELGSKALGCFGGCDFHGRPHNLYWTHLSRTAEVGSQEILVSDDVDWMAGDEIVITTTGYRANETEKHVISSVANDKRTITLADPLRNRHLGESYSAGSWNYDIRAEVGLLTRNIKIKGQSYNGINAEAFGARVLVSSVTDTEGNLVQGWARFSNVEFFQTGQEGWTEEWDPRFSLAWVDTGTPSSARPSFITGCAFHDGFSTAIGTFGANQINITKNVVHRTIHDGIRLTGSGHRLEQNLVTMTLFRGAYHNRFERTNFLDWQASFELSKAEDLVLIGNTAAGSERIGFHIDGEACGSSEESAWSDNTAHGCLHGIHIFKEDGIEPCSVIRNFVVYKSWDYGIYHQTTVNIEIKSTIIMDCTVAYFPLIFDPSARSHMYADKSAKLENILCVGRSESFDPQFDFMDEMTDKNLLVRSAGPDRKAPRNPTGGKTCIMLPLFQTGPNGAPFKAFNLNQNYPALHGLLDINGLHAHRYTMNSDGTRDLVFYTNPENEDAYHPTHLRQTTMSQVERESMVFFARPSLGLINPSDCVDMECDAMKNVLINDFDGGFLGEAGAIIPQAEYGWDDPNEIKRGLGDYRIPKTLLSTPDGLRIPVEDLADERGILRNSACSYEAAWQAYDCHGDGVLDYRMLVIESLDDDSETRRLSPVALLADRYIDLNNGPQDHGWCFGYTCQLRLSTFYAIIASKQNYDIYFTGVTPRNLRLHFLNVNNSETVRVAIWYSRPERLDVRRADSGLYIQPENAYYNPATESWALHPVTPDNVEMYKPSIEGKVNGANFFDRFNQLLYVTLRGSEPVEIITAPAVIVAFNLPAVSVDDFFEENLISNLATFLGIDPSMIRVVEIVRETSKRKRRQADGSEGIQIKLEISEAISNSTATPNVTNNNQTDPQLVVEELNSATNKLLEAFQDDSLSSILNQTVTGFASTKAVENSTSENLEEPSLTSLVEHKVPSYGVLEWNETEFEEYLSFQDPPIIRIFDQQNELVPDLGGNWTAYVSINESDGGDLVGETVVSFIEGKAVLNDLRILSSGDYTLEFLVTSPNNPHFFKASHRITIFARSVLAQVLPSNVQLLAPDDNITFEIELLNSRNEPLEDPDNHGLVWFANITKVSLDNESLSDQSLSDQSLTGETLFEFADASYNVFTTGYTIVDPFGEADYRIGFSVYTVPEYYSIILTSPVIRFNATARNNSTPTTSTDNPTTSADNPTTSTDNPSTSTDNPTTSADNPTTSADNPTTSTDNPTTSTDNPTTSADNPTTSADNPTTSTDNPTTSTDNPTTSADNPTTSTDNPTTSANYPTTSTDNPTNSTDNPTNSTTNPTNPTFLDLECPSVQGRHRQNPLSLWLCDYIKWKIEVLTEWKEAIQQWSETYDLEDFLENEFPEMRPNHQCDDLEVICTNLDQKRVLNEVTNCSISYCLDGQYKSGPGFKQWKKDYKRWRKTFRKWQKLVRSLRKYCKTKRFSLDDDFWIEDDNAWDNENGGYERKRKPKEC